MHACQMEPRMLDQRTTLTWAEVFGSWQERFQAMQMALSGFWRMCTWLFI